MRETCYGFVGIKHRKRNPWPLECCHFISLLSSTITGLKHQSKFSSTWNNYVRAIVLISKSVTANTYRLCPLRNKPRDILANNRFSKNCASQNIPDRPVGRFPHFFQLKFSDPFFVWSDR